MNDSLPRRIVLRGLALLLFLSPLKFGNPLESFTNPGGFMAGTAAPRHVLEWLLSGWPPTVGIAAALILAAAAFVAFRISFPTGSWMSWLPAAWLATQLLALPFSIYREASLNVVFFFAAAALAYYAAAAAVRDERDLRALLTALLCGFVVVCWIGFYQKHGGLAQAAVWAAQYRPEGMEEGVLRKLHDPRGVRIFSTFVYPPSFAGYLLLAAGPAVGAILLWRERLTRPAGIALATALVVAAGFCLIWTRSKGGLLALALAGLTTLFFLRLDPKKIFLVGAGLLTVAAAVFLLGYGFENVAYAFRTGGQRVAYWRAAWSVFTENPWVGTGPDTFGSIHALHQTAGAEYARLAHNNFIQMASDSGILGFASFTALWTLGLIDLLRRLAGKTRWSLTASLGLGLWGWTWHNAMDFDLYIPGIALPAFVLLGAVEGLVHPRELCPTKMRLPARWARMAAAAVCMALLLPVAQRTRAFYAFTDAHRFKDADPPNLYAASSAMDRATRLAPSNAAYWNHLARVRADLGQGNAAVDAARRAIEQDPFRAGHHWLYGVLLYQTDQGLSERAHQAMLRAVELAPRNAAYHWQLGLLYARLDGGVSARARASLERARQCDPDNPEYRKLPNGG